MEKSAEKKAVETRWFAGQTQLILTLIVKGFWHFFADQPGRPPEDQLGQALSHLKPY